MGVPIPCEQDSTSKLKLNSKEAHIIRDAALIMIDEILMMNWKILNMLDRMFRTLTNCNVFMGGKCVVLMGDLRQCPPVVRGGDDHKLCRNQLFTENHGHFSKYII